MSPTSTARLLLPSFACWKRGLQSTSTSKTSVSCSKELILNSLSKTKRCVFLLHLIFIKIYQVSHSMSVLLFPQVLQEAAGGAVSIDNQDPGANGFRPSRQDVFEFIKQCGEGDVSRVSFVASLSVHVTCQKIFARCNRSQLINNCRDGLLLTESDEQTSVLIFNLITFLRRSELRWFMNALEYQILDCF